MILSMVRIVPAPTRRVELLEVLHTVEGPTRAQPGCGMCHIYHEDGPDQAVLLCEQWESEAALHCHVCSEPYQRVLAALELSSQPPEICFYHVAVTQGIELIHQLRSPAGDASPSAPPYSVRHSTHQTKIKSSKR